MRHRALLFISATAAVVGTVAVIGLTAWWRDNGTSPTSQDRHPSDISLHMGMSLFASSFHASWRYCTKCRVLATRVTSGGLTDFLWKKKMALPCLMQGYPNDERCIWKYGGTEAIRTEA